ncbi:DUF3108 domain-containing protein [uncultured Lacinutrix sp.]|uniref:DUF3108 domain-containing protein n=1 Tax=uncultured Lacinutrix sp. TaxID=574032 RepID=UPI002634B300|nr:DUF3108 domain-containing protein [uncultured Lacinutrix sp.]
MKYLFIVLISCFSLTINAQNNAFQAGEKLTFTAGYKMSGLMTDFAQVTMETSNVKTKTSTLLRLKCKATSYSKWDSFFKIRDLYESYVNPRTITPYLYKREINEGGHYKFMKYNFNPKNNSVKSQRKKRRGDGTIWEVNKNYKIGNSTKDIVSTIYHLRSLDIKKAPIGSSDSFKVLFDNEEKAFTFTLVGKETINTAIGKKECYKLRISLVGNNVLKGSGNYLWLTADENKIPVYAKFKVAIGSGELKIKSATGLKN